MYLPTCLPIMIYLWWLLSQFQTWNPRCWRRRRQRLTTGTTLQHNRSTATASTADNTTDNTTDNTAETVRMIDVSFFVCFYHYPAVYAPGLSCLGWSCLRWCGLGVLYRFAEWSCLCWSGLDVLSCVTEWACLCFGLVWLRDPAFPSGLWFWNPRLVLVVGSRVFSFQLCLIFLLTLS